MINHLIIFMLFSGQVSLRACNEHAVRMSHNLKNRRHGIFKARSPYAPFEGHLGEVRHASGMSTLAITRLHLARSPLLSPQEFKPVWEGDQVALLNLSNRCFVSATKNGQLLSDCNTSSPGIPFSLFIRCF